MYLAVLLISTAVELTDEHCTVGAAYKDSLVRWHMLGTCDYSQLFCRVSADGRTHPSVRILVTHPPSLDYPYALLVTHSPSLDSTQISQSQ